MARFILAGLLILVFASTVNAKPLEFRIWQLQDYHMDHIKRLVDMAAEQNVNRIQISHEIVMDVEQPLNDPKLVKDINTICDWAHSKGIKVDMWTHELNGIPDSLKKDGKVNLDDPKIWDFVKGKYAKLFELCPGLDGLVLTMHETAQSIYHDGSVASSISPGDRVAKLIDDMASVCEAFDKTFFVRTFSYQPNELKYIQEGLKKAKSDVIAMTKCVPHDWQPYYPYNPTIGAVGNKKQIVEFDLGHEFTGLSKIPYIMIDYMKRHLEYDLSKGIVGAVFRIERHKWRAVDTPNQAVIDVFTKVLNDPSADPYALYKEWLAERYPEKTVPYLYSAFMRTEEIVDKGLYVLGFWVTNHSRLPDYNYANGSLHRRTSAKWDPTKKDIEQELFNPTPETVKKIAAEKDIALNLVNASLADIEKAKPYLEEADYKEIRNYFEREKAMVEVWKATMEIMFGMHTYHRTKAESDRELLSAAADRLEKLTEKHQDHLIEMAGDYSNPTWDCNVRTAHGWIKRAREMTGELKE